MLNLSLILEDSARRFATSPAFTHGKTYSYVTINETANQVANALVSIGIKPGDKVALSCPNLPYFPILYYGILKAGGVVVPLNILLKEEEIIYHLKDCDAKVYFCYTGSDTLPMGRFGHKAFTAVNSCAHFFMIMPEQTMPSLIDKVQTFYDLIHKQSTAFETLITSAEDTAIIIYTSGTTGASRGAELTHNNLFTNALVSTEIVKTVQEDTQLIVLPLFHIFAMTVLMNAGIYKGAHSILMPKFDPQDVFETIDANNISVFAGVPTMYWQLLHYNNKNIDDTIIARNLRICISGGASLPLTVLHDFEKRFEVTILEGYGMSEGSPVVTFNQIEAGRKPGSIGKMVWGLEVKLVNDIGEEVPVGEKGELVYRGPNVMKGYYKNPEATAIALKNGWLYSGDIATKDEGGFYYIVDRKKDIIIRGGYNIYPREVETVLMKNEAISLTAVVGVPHEKLGEEVKAFVVLKEGAAITAEEIIAFAMQHLAAYKYPRLIEFINALPVNAAGKIVKKDLKKIFTG